MKRLLRHTLAASTLAFAVAATAAAAEPGYVDFGRITGPAKGDFVEVSLGKGMLKLAGVIANCADPEVGGIVGGLSGVRINVVGLDDTNRDATLETIQNLRRDLPNQGWEKIVTARGQKSEDVAVYVKQQDGELIEGVVVTVIDERKEEAVLVNIVGRIKVEQLAAVGDHLKIAHLRGARKANGG
jgi:hypothetical protein